MLCSCTDTYCIKTPISLYLKMIDRLSPYREKLNYVPTHYYILDGWLQYKEWMYVSKTHVLVGGCWKETNQHFQDHKRTPNIYHVSGPHCILKYETNNTRLATFWFFLWICFPRILCAVQCSAVLSGTSSIHAFDLSGVLLKECLRGSSILLSCSSINWWSFHIDSS